MENMDKELTVPKWMLINRPKIPQMLQNLSAEFVCPSPKVVDLKKKRLQKTMEFCCIKQSKVQNKEKHHD
jgi:hypothetical protein